MPPSGALQVTLLLGTRAHVFSIEWLLFSTSDFSFVFHLLVSFSGGNSTSGSLGQSNGDDTSGDESLSCRAIMEGESSTESFLTAATDIDDAAATAAEAAANGEFTVDDDDDNNN